MSADLALVERHLRLLSERLPDDLLVPLVSIRKQLVRLQSAAAANDVGHAVSAAARLAGSHQLYAGMHAIERRRLRELKNAGKRGGRDDVAALVGFWLDVDVTHSTHASADLPPTISDADLILAELPVASIIWRTGGGLQAQWVFDRPVDCSGSKRHAVQRASKRWHQHAQLVARRIGGWHVDDTSDLARVVRLGGSLNRKHDVPPVVELHDVHWSSGRTYSANDLAAFVEQRMPAERAPQTQPTTPVRRSAGVLGHVDSLAWSAIWPAGWRRVADADVAGVRCERWLRPGSSSAASVTCWPDGGCVVFSSSVAGLPPGNYSKSQVMAWALGLLDVRDLVAELHRRADEQRNRRRQW